MARLYLYDDKRSILHTLLGFLSAFTLAWGLVILVLYTLYEIQEKENPIATLGDVVEFIIGYVYGLAVVVWVVYARLKGVL